MFCEFGERYVTQIRALTPRTVLRVTDKMPANFFYIGLIKTILPKAKIIHSMRDPMDSCFSCFGRLFNETMEFAYDLNTLGNYYVNYMQMMQYWHDVLPKGSILDVPYESVVDDIEKQAKRMLEFVGLPWNDKCLEFYENKRQVHTASIAQVRQPIYKSSVARWEHFATHLAPLMEVVKDYR